MQKRSEEATRVSWGVCCLYGLEVTRLFIHALNRPTTSRSNSSLFLWLTRFSGHLCYGDAFSLRLLEHAWAAKELVPAVSQRIQYPSMRIRMNQTDVKIL